MPSGLHIREAVPDDAPLLAALTRHCWAGTVAASSSGHNESPSRVAQQLQQGGAFILMVDAVVAGSVRWLPLETESGAWEILRMGVHPEFRGEHLSTHLLEAVVHHALLADVNELRLAVRNDQSRIVDLYATLGFELAPELDYSHANPLEPPPTVMRRVL
ncbi:GNAT family N-acetyltransferase [Actimicrobium antarcticum]|uniref:N-acetyltransferase domain-containing protein n=1 Tax=Actimicrobium antarcticum TaxID=1051899 RepID=A0ABP7U109_9BURK